MKKTILLCIFLILTVTAFAQLKGDFGVWARTPIALKKKKFQFEYTFEKHNFNNALKGWYYSGDSIDHPKGDYNGFAYLGFNLRYGFTERLEINLEQVYTQISEFTPRVFDRFNFGLPELQLKYQVNKQPYYNTVAAITAGATFDIYNIRSSRYPFTDWYQLGLRLQSQLHKNLLLRYGGSIYYYHSQTNMWQSATLKNTSGFNVNAQYTHKEKLGVFAEYEIGGVWDRYYQFGLFYDINESTQLMGAYNHNLIVINEPFSDNFTTDIFKLGVYKTF